MSVLCAIAFFINRLNESPSQKEGKSALAREGMLGESDPQ